MEKELETLLRQFELLDEINQSLKETDPEQVRKNIETMICIISVFSIENTYSR